MSTRRHYPAGMRVSKTASVAVVIAIVMGASIGAALASAGNARERSSPPTTSGILKRPERIVQLGDSIASGEGTLYGYKYDTKNKQWIDGDINVMWPKPYPGCHVSPDAYANHVATFFHAALTQFACTGASFADGIVGPAIDADSKVRRPAEFGNWVTKKNLNEEYDDANPDLLLVTLGADDAQFSDVVKQCVKNAYKYASYLAKEECIASNPGATVQKDFFEFIPKLEQNYATLISWIDERAKATSRAAQPKIVFTTYANPFPDTGVKCNDVSYLYPEQVTYLSSLVDQMNRIILGSRPTLGNGQLAVADISSAYQRPGQDHRWCSDDPWVYGLSIYSFYHPSSFNSQAPFHPTPQGQRAIAELVERAVTQLFNRQQQPIVPTTTSSPASTTTTKTTSPPATTTTTSSP
jgi:lysophospholipase L1-like esterase